MRAPSPAAVAACLLLGACAGAPPPEPFPVPPPAPSPAPRGQRFDVNPPLGPVAAPVRLAAPSSIARDRVERLAVLCWLDAELAAEILVVDRRSGDMVAAGGNGELLRIGFVPAGTLDTDVLLSGPALADPGRSARMGDALARALEGAEPAC